MRVQRIPFLPLVAAITVALSLGAISTASAQQVRAQVPTARSSKPVKQGPLGASNSRRGAGQDKVAADQPPKKRNGKADQSSHTPNATKLKAVVVTGLRESQMKSVEIKRRAAYIEDSITAQNIGELPDTTIADSLQRITGVQINRTAGVGSTVTVRGLPEVGTTLNGDAFITAQQIVSQQPNFSAIPSELFEGADVIKSNTASMADAGISGTINLRTWHPFDFKRGFTFSGQGAESYGNGARK